MQFKVASPSRLLCLLALLGSTLAADFSIANSNNSIKFDGNNRTIARPGSQPLLQVPIANRETQTKQGGNGVAKEISEQQGIELWGGKEKPREERRSNDPIEIIYHGTKMDHQEATRRANGFLARPKEAEAHSDPSWLSRQKAKKRKSRHLVPNSANILNLSVEKLEIESGTRSSEDKPTIEGRSRNRTLKCRLDPDKYVDLDTFMEWTCARCYIFIPQQYFRKKLELVNGTMALKDPKDNRTLSTVRDIELISQTFLERGNFNRWQTCCNEAIDCCIANAQSLRMLDSDGQLSDKIPSEFCPATWDGLSCWPDSPAGIVAQRDCPHYIFYNDNHPVCHNSAFKTCLQNGTWFRRGEHEWTNYHHCDNLDVVQFRMIFGALWYLTGALMILPAWYVLDKMPNRGSSKRVQITRKLLGWLFLNGLLACLYKAGILMRVFPDRNDTKQMRTWLQYKYHRNSSQHFSQIGRDFSIPNSQYYDSQTTLDPFGSDIGESHSNVGANLSKLIPQLSSSDLELSSTNHSSELVEGSLGILTNISSGQVNEERQTSVKGATLGLGSWWMQSSDYNGTAFNLQSQIHLDPAKLDQPPRKTSSLGVAVCWPIVVGVRITRLFGYAWMFTGAVYLCSLLHFAPAEPPALFTKSLMLITNIFPTLIGIIYVSIRSMTEYSPLNLIVKGPYYFFIGDRATLEQLWEEELDCWLDQAVSPVVEEIPDLPNLILVVLNFFLFVITLIIMCRISRPGSTRPEMSLSDYCKAAGTLVLLYGAHYTLLVYRPPESTCLMNQILHYLSLFVDGSQGLAVSYVFCYKTPEGREELRKCWSRFMPSWCPGVSSSNRERDQTSDYSRSSAIRSGISHMSSVSVCNGTKPDTELQVFDDEIDEHEDDNDSESDKSTIDYALKIHTKQSYD